MFSDRAVSQVTEYDMAEADVSNAAIDDSHIAIGSRVRLLYPSPQMELRSDTGTVIRPDEWDGCYIIHLDAPATLRHGDDPPEEVEEVAEAADNLSVIPSLRGISR